MYFPIVLDDLNSQRLTNQAVDLSRGSADFSKQASLAATAVMRNVIQQRESLAISDWATLRQYTRNAEHRSVGWNSCGIG